LFGNSAPAAPAAPAPATGDDLFGGPAQPAASQPAPEAASPAAPAPAAPATGDDLFGAPVTTPANPETPANPPETTPANDPFGAVTQPAEELLVMRTWTDNTGTFSVNGKLIAILDGEVRLLKENGRTCTVPMRRLSPPDAEYVHMIAGKLGQGILIQLASR
jgi:hypothetical protein